jgi:antitoxin component YwqK of YwqJK toxin-antitoxin module|tara:strand:+ start:336 stop:644 length:309 start_codon:yes stop_codon:yes gene_type:complete
MKHLLIITIGAVVLVGCIHLEKASNDTTVPKETREVSEDQIEFRKGLRYVKGEAEPFTGTVIEYSSRLKPTFDRLKRITPYVDGQVHGSAITQVEELKAECK